jgi:Spy/CpxP family protein refolding chaperone
VHAARDHVFATFAESHAAHQADMNDALTLFQADRIDQAKLAELRARHQAEAKKQGDAIVQALSDAHDAFTAPQRQKLADYLRAHRPPQADGMKPMFRHMIDEHVDDVLDQIHASAQQRDKVHAAVARAFDAIGSQMGDHAAHFDEAIALLTADKIDNAKIDAVRAERLAKMQRVGDAIVQALTDIHDTLDAGQRKQVADIVKSHHESHRHGG